MPRLKRPYNRHEDLQRAIYGAMGVQGKTVTDLAATFHKDPRTVAAKIKDPDKMTLGDLRRLCGTLGIPVDAVREMIKF